MTGTETQDDRAERLEAESLLKDEQIRRLVREVESLKAKAEHREVIDLAKGIIMGTMHCGPDAAFATLIARSQKENRKLWAIAADLVAAQDESDPTGS